MHFCYYYLLNYCVIFLFLAALLSASDVADAEASDAAIRESLKKRMDFTQSLMEKV